MALLHCVVFTSVFVTPLVLGLGSGTALKPPICVKEMPSRKHYATRKLHDLMLNTVATIMHNHHMNNTLSKEHLCNLSTSYARYLFRYINWSIFKYNKTHLHTLKRSLFFASVEFVASEVTSRRMRKCQPQQSYFYDVKQGLCLPHRPKQAYHSWIGPKLELIISMSGNLLSICSMLAILMLHCRLRISDTMMGRNLVYLCLVLVLIHGIQALSPVRQHNIIFCTLSTILLHWLHIGALVWILFASIELYLQLHRPFHYQSTSDNPSPKARLIFRIMAFICSSIVIIVCLTMNYMKSKDVSSELNGVCLPMQYWRNLLTFIIPVSILILVNTICLIGSIVRLRFDIRIKESDNDKDGERLTLTMIIFQISTVIGLSWILGFAAKFTESGSVYFAFVLISSLKGIIVYSYLIFKRWIWTLCRQMCEIHTNTRPKKTVTEFEILV